MASLKDDMDEYNEVVYQAQNIDKPGVGEGIAMGFMALGDAYGGAWGGQTDFLGSYLKSKREREKLARGKKLTPFQYAKLVESRRANKLKQDRQGKRDQLSEANTKSQMISRLYKLKKERKDFNNKLPELNRKRRPNDQIAPMGVSPEEKGLLELYKKNFGSIGPETPPSPIKPTPKIKTKSKVTPRKITFTETDQETINELGFGGTDEDKRNSLRHFRSVLRKNQGLGDRAKAIALGETVDFSTMSEADKDKFRKVTAKNNRIGETNEAKKEQEFKKYGRTKSDQVLKNVNLWENRRETINKALFEYLSHQTKGQVFGNFSLDDLVVSGDKVFYKKKYTDKDGQVKVHQLLIEPPSIEGVAFGENVIEYQKRGIPGRAKFFQAMAALKNQALNKLSGAAVSTQEYERFQRQFEGDKLKSPAALINALKSLELEHKKDLLKATDDFNRQFGDDPRAKEWWGKYQKPYFNKLLGGFGKRNPELFLTEIDNYNLPSFRSTNNKGQPVVVNFKESLRKFRGKKKRNPMEVVNEYNRLVARNIRNLSQQNENKSEQKEPGFFKSFTDRFFD